MKIRKEKDKKDRRNKKDEETKIVIYCISHKTWEEEMGKENPDPLKASPLAYVATEAEAEEYCKKYFFLKHYEHFRLWCQCHGKNVLSTEDWCEYIDNLIEDCGGEEPDEPLNVTKLIFSVEEIAAVLRLTSFCLPVGGSWESVRELDYIRDTIKDDPEYVQICSNLTQFLKDINFIPSSSLDSDNATEEDPDDFYTDILA